jgi:plasmid stability protein
MSGMATLIVRQVDEELVRELKERAKRYGRSAEAEHRLLLRKALTRPQGSAAELWKRLSERAPDLTDAEWEKVDRAIRQAQGRHDDEAEEAAEQAS